MGSFTLRNSAIKGIVSAVPAQVEGIDQLARVFGDENSRKIAQATGVYERHISSPDQCTSDLCFYAAVRLIERLNWTNDSIDALIMVSQTFDYFQPATSCCLHGRLGLSKDCAAFDIALGCSGYVYGLWSAASLIAGGCRRILLLAGETPSKVVAPFDRSSRPLLGDAGTATALEYQENERMYFEMGTDGTGYNHLIIPAGGYRIRRNAETARRTEREGGNVRSDEDVFIDGPAVFTFVLREVPPMLNKVLASAKWNAEQVDAFVFHQANRFMLDHLSKKMKLHPDRVPYSLEEFGNTSSASIPLTISHKLRQLLQKKRTRLVLAGFGIGLSWGAVALETAPFVLPEIEVVQ
ncbi:MAG: ketoacyl-ACP synthase III [Syntrophobacteraceae bacterium]